LFIPGGDGAPPDNGGVLVLLLYIVGVIEGPAITDNGEALDPKDATAGWDPGDD